MIMMVMMYSFHPPIVHNFSFFDGLASHRSMSSCSKTDPSSSKTDPFSSKTDPFSSKMAFVKTHVSLEIFSAEPISRTERDGTWMLYPRHDVQFTHSV